MTASENLRLRGPEAVELDRSASSIVYIATAPPDDLGGGSGGIEAIRTLKTKPD